MNTRHAKILDAVLAQILRHGWTLRALEKANAAKTFPTVSDAVAAFADSIDSAMQEKIRARRNFPALRVRDKITFALRSRFEAMEPNREAVRRMIVWFMMPRNLRAGGKHLWHSADLIWTAAGDDSTDYNRYTKRILLIAVMKATGAFWLNDESKNRQDTWDFLDRRIADVMAVGKGLSVAKTIGVADIVSFVRSRFAA